MRKGFIPAGLLMKVLYGVVGLAVLVLLMQQVVPVLSPYGIVGTIASGTIVVLVVSLIMSKLVGLPMPLSVAIGFLLALGLIGLSL